MSGNWTPGPWDVGDGHEVYSVPRYRSVAMILGDDYATANAHLIAAAPDLYAALQSLHDNIAEYARINNLGGFDNQDMRQARAALARARGDAS